MFFSVLHMAIINIKGVKIVSELYPVRLIPVFKDYLWGGTKFKNMCLIKIRTEYTGRKLGTIG